MNRSKELLKNSLILSLGILTPKLISLLILPILTTYLTTSEYGNYDLVVTIVSFIVPVITLQIQQAAFRNLIAKRGDGDSQRRIVVTSILFVVFVSFISAPITFLVFYLYKFDNVINICICIMVFGESLYLLTGQIIRGLGKNVTYTAGVVTYSVVNFAGVVIFILALRLGLMGVILSVTVAYLLSAVLLFTRTLSLCGFKLKDASLNELKELLIFSSPIVPSSISLWVVNLSDRILVIHYLGSSINGIYAVANKIPTLFATLYNVFNLAWTETAAKAADEERNPEKYYSSMFSFLFTFLGGIMLLVFALIPVFYKIFINTQFHGAHMHTVILCFGVFFNSIVAFYASIYIAIRRTKQIGVSSAVGAILNFFINILLIRHIGLYAASISTALSYFIIMMVRGVSLQKVLKLSYKWNEIIIGSILFAVSGILVYFYSIWSMCICFIIAVIFNLMYNKKIVIFVSGIIRSKFSKKAKNTRTHIDNSKEL